MSPKIVLSILSLLISLTSFSQSKIDSLIRISSIQNGIEQLHTQLQIAENFGYGENGDTIVYYASRCYQQAMSLNDSLSLLKATLIWGSGLFSQKEYHQAILKTNTLFELANDLNRKKEIIQGLYLKAKCHQRLHNYEVAIKLYKKGYEESMLILSVKDDAHITNYCKAILKQMTYCYWYASKSQDGIDYFQQIITNNPDVSDDVKHGYYSNIAFLYNRNIDIDMAEKYLLKAMEISLSGTKQDDLFQDLSYLGCLYYTKGDYEKAIENYQKSLQIAKEINSSNMISYITTNLGSCYEKKGDLKAAVSLLYDGIEMFQNRKDSIGIAIGYQYLGALMLKWNNYRDAKTYLKKSLLCNEKLRLKNKVLTNYLDLSIASLQNNEKDSTQFYLQNLEKQLKDCNDKKLIAYFHMYKAQFLLKFYSKPEQALQQAKIGLTIAKNLHAKPVIALGNYSLGKSYLQMGNLLLAKKYILRSWKDYKSMNRLYDRANTAESLSLIYNNLHQTDSAYQYLRETEKIYSEIRKRDQILALYQKDNDFSVQLSKQEKQMLAKENQQLFNRIFLMRCFYISVTLLLLGFLIFYLSKRNNRLATEICKKELIKRELEHQHHHHKTRLLHKREQIQDKENIIEVLTEKLKHNQNFATKPADCNDMEFLLNPKLSTEEDWDNYLLLFNKKNPNFLPKLKSNYPDLSRNEIKIFSLTKLELSTREMAKVLMISPSSVNTARYRLRKKLNLDSSEKLEDVVKRINHEANL
jgi:tetratricopeptide (TPR) repeat protein